jgi:ribosomal-protein-alanine N-acetyltransferase
VVFRWARSRDAGAVELQTSRLVLRPVTTADAAAVVAYRGDPQVVRYLSHDGLTLEQATSLLENADVRWPASAEERFNVTLAVVLDDHVIGDVHVWNTGEPLQPASDDPGEVWLGYAIHPRHHGQGYATEAVSRVVEWLRQTGIKRIHANTYCENVASVKLLQRLGFQQAAVFGPDEDGCGKRLASIGFRRDILTATSS